MKMRRFYAVLIIDRKVRVEYGRITLFFALIIQFNVWRCVSVKERLLALFYSIIIVMLYDESHGKLDMVSAGKTSLMIEPLQ